MKVLKEGHLYELTNVDGVGDTQRIQFIEKRQNVVGDKLETINDGTTNEDVIEVVIDRLQYLDEKHPCWENKLAITKLVEALIWLHKRTDDRKQRGVEGTNQN